MAVWHDEPSGKWLSWSTWRQIIVMLIYPGHR
jgi:hypothetical protein